MGVLRSLRVKGEVRVIESYTESTVATYHHSVDGFDDVKHLVSRDVSVFVKVVQRKCPYEHRQNLSATHYKVAFYNKYNIVINYPKSKETFGTTILMFILK